MSGWAPRASSIGGYFTCEYRAAFDRAIAEGIADEAIQAAFASKEMNPSPYADMGTCIHFTLQDGLRCEFPGPAAEFAPTDAEWINAAGLFGGDVAHTQVVARQSATLAAKHLPATPDGAPWLAESKWKTKDVQGHIDFLSQDLGAVWDLKTTTRPPEHHRIKASHLYQLLTYWILVGRKPTTGGILYVDSKAQWVLPIPVDFTDPAMGELADHTIEYIRYLRSKRLFSQAVPRLGAHCSDEWCPYLEQCKNRFLPPAKEVSYARSTRVATVAPIPGLSVGA